MPETEKITINMSVVDLGKIDLLVEEGFYQNRTDFLRTAIRSKLDSHNDEMQTAITRKSYVIGVLHLAQKDIAKAFEKGERMKISVIGLLVMDQDIDIPMAVKVIESIHVNGVMRASDALKEALASRIG